jgi:diketogulonate reductase-like aldo/keto reductase
MQRVQLSTKALMPITGFGTWRLREPELTPAINEAISAGYRHFDGAEIYGNEAELGSCLSKAISVHLLREDVNMQSDGNPGRLI